MTTWTNATANAAWDATEKAQAIDQPALFAGDGTRNCYCRINGWYEGIHIRGDQTAGCAASNNPIPGQVEHPFTGWHHYSALNPDRRTP